MIFRFMLSCRIVISFKFPYFVRQFGSQIFWIPDRKYFLGPCQIHEVDQLYQLRQVCRIHEKEIIYYILHISTNSYTFNK